MAKKRLVLTRYKHRKTATYGHLHVYANEKHIFFTPVLELPWRENRRNVSRIPAGSYGLKLEYSPRFKQKLWEVKGVPGRSEIKFHAANFVHELNGCIAFARTFQDINGDGVDDSVYSRKAMNAFHKAMGADSSAHLTIIDIF